MIVVHDCYGREFLIQDFLQEYFIECQYLWMPDDVDKKEREFLIQRHKDGILEEFG